MAGLSNLQNSTAYRWWVHPRGQCDTVTLEHGASESRREAEKAAMAAYVKVLRNPQHKPGDPPERGYTVDNTQVTLNGPVGRWTVNPLWKWVRV